ncbi:MAG: hypothetical protein FJ118_15605 [Deltaproteobacteria bacterium]|nr:hypothetical protein [Deltaproteobacteria bacterium]
MSDKPTTVDEWKRLHASRLVQCRWGCMLTEEACRTFQSRRSRFVIHFNGSGNPYPRVNADYLQCVYPEPCDHLISEEEAEALAEERFVKAQQRRSERSDLLRAAREKARLVSPEPMLGEAEWTRSLVTK